MDGTLTTALVHGLALGGVLAVAGTWSRLARLEGVPHLGVGGVAGVVAAVALRLAPMSPWAALIAGLVLGGVLGRAALGPPRRVAAGPFARQLVYLPDVAVLAALIALSIALRPATAIALPFGPLGGQPGTVAALLAMVGGIAGAVVIASRHVAGRRAARWALAGCALALPTVLASGALSAGPLLLSGIVGVPDTAGLALRAAGVGLLARRGVWAAIAAAAVLGVGEMALTTLRPGTGMGWLPATLALVTGVALLERDRRRLAGAAA
jgi:hypothetical protein